MSQQPATAIITAADPTPEFYRLADTYGLGWGHVEHNSSGTVLCLEGPEDALRAFLAREDTWGLDDEGLAEFVKVVQPPPTSWTFRAAASVWFETDSLGNVTSVDVNVLDGVDHPDEDPYDDEGNPLSPEALKVKAEVWERARDRDWKFPPDMRLPKGFDFGGVL